MGLGNERQRTSALGYLKRFGSVTVLNGHIHQVLQKVEGNVTFHTAMSTAFPQPAPGTAPNPGPFKVPAEKLRSMLGLTSVKYLARQIFSRRCRLEPQLDPSQTMTHTQCQKKSSGTLVRHRISQSIPLRDRGRDEERRQHQQQAKQNRDQRLRLQSSDHNREVRREGDLDQSGRRTSHHRERREAV